MKDSFPTKKHAPKRSVIVRQRVAKSAIKGSVARQPIQNQKLPETKSIDSSPVSDLSALDGWSTVELRDEATRELFIQFWFPNEDGEECIVEVPAHLTIPQMCRELRKYTKNLPDKPRTAARFIERVVATSAASYVRASRPGWKWSTSDRSKSPIAFALPHLIIPATAKYRWSASNKSLLGSRVGTLEGWRKSVASFASDSNYLTFCLCCAAAAPLARFSGLPELAVFNLVGASSVGKTTAVRAAMSTLAPPNAIRNWDLKNRALEEAAAQHNDLLLVLNGAERLPGRERVVLIDRIIHMLTEGESTSRSVVVQYHLPNESWTNIVLSTSNSKGAEMVASSREWDDQDSVRFIDIPVPCAEAGGIFDRVSAASEKNGSKLVKELEEGMLREHGTFFPKWIEFLMASNPADKLQDWTKIYLRQVKPSPGIEERIARKFALVYAAGKMAVEAGLLPFANGQVLKAVQTIHSKSIDFRTRPSEALRAVLKSLAKSLNDARLFREVSAGDEIVVGSVKEFLGIMGIQKGESIVGFRFEGLVARFGEESAQALISWLRQKRILREGDGNLTTVQLRVKLTVGRISFEKPRFLIADEERLKKALVPYAVKKT